MEATTASKNEAVTEVRTMRAVVHSRFGDPSDAIKIGEVAIPVAGNGEVLVAVDASGIAIGDYLTVTGRPYIARPMFGVRTPKERIAGLEMSGTVVAIGAGVSRVAVGDAVFGYGKGTLAEYVAISQDAVVRRPASTTAEQAAAVPISGLAALQAVRDTGGVTAGQKVLVVGASGAVGTFAVQIAKALGAEVTGVASSRNLDLLRRIGADDVIDYTRQGLSARGVRYDVIIDLAGNRKINDLRAVLSPTGTLVIVGGSGGPVTMGFGRTIRAMALNLFVRQTLTSFMAKYSGEDLEVLARMTAAGEIVPVLDQTYPLERTVEALAHVGTRHTSGKTVVTV